MTPFLKQVADHYYRLGNIDSRCFIFPNRRSLVFFRKYLSESVAEDPLARPIVAPQMLTINDFFSRTAGLRVTDRVTLLIELHKCYSKLNPKAEALDEFIFWGDVILGDFNDVDKYLVDPHQIFTNIADFRNIQEDYSYLSDSQRKAIEAFVNHFNDHSGRITVDLGSDNPNVKERFLQIWNILYPLYQEYNSTLRAKGMAYEGMIYRELAQRMKTAPIEFEKTHVFIGLNALNECEKTVMRRMRDLSKAEFCWDYCTDMIRDPKNKSSLFMADNVIEFPQEAVWEDESGNVPQVNVVSVSSSVGQAKRLEDILRMIAERKAGGDMSSVGSLDSRTKGTDCAVVLPDETLLIPVLNSVPRQIRDINVTMGYPMTASELHSMMSDISSIQMHSVERKGERYFYHRQVWSLFSNSLFKKALDPASTEIISRVKSDAKYYIPQSDLNGTPVLDVIFRAVVTDLKSLDHIEEFTSYQTDVITSVASALTDSVDMAVELEFAKEYYRCVNVLKRKGLRILPMTYVKLLEQLLASVSVPFSGEPLKGLQIMGPLETRALDFTNLVIMSANEGVFPRRSVSSSFVPPQLRKGFGLPTYEYQDAVWAYYFYRMISRAEEVWLLCDSRTEGLRSGEESRYIKQLEYHFRLPVRRYVVKFEGAAPQEMPQIVKTREDVEKIKATALSATAIQNYLSCPAKFYYSLVKGLRADEEVMETLDSGMFGTVYHDTMWALYSHPDFMKEDAPAGSEHISQSSQRMQEITAGYIQDWLGREKEIRAKVRALILDQLNAVEMEGRNLVVADVIVKYVIKTLQRDLELMDREGVSSFKVLGLEKRVSGLLCGQKFKGFIDRLDSFHNDQVRVVDYKTGKVLDDDEKIHDGNAEAIAESIFNPAVKTADRAKIALQFYIYDMLLKGYEGKKIYNSVYTTSRLFRESIVNVPRNEVFCEAMTARMQLLLEEIYDVDVPFVRTEDETACTYCDFKMICWK